MLFRDEDEDPEVLPFADRSEAGSAGEQTLGLRRPRRRDYSRTSSVGVPVAWEVASTLHVLLDLLVVSKLGTPWNRELAMGAVAEGGVQYSISPSSRHCACRIGTSKRWWRPPGKNLNGVKSHIAAVAHRWS
jgi:hypothetical protein